MLLVKMLSLRFFPFHFGGGGGRGERENRGWGGDTKDSRPLLPGGVSLVHSISLGAETSK